MPELKPLVNGCILSVYAVPELVLMTHFIQSSVGFNHGIKPSLMPFASLVHKAGYKFSIILSLRNTFGKFLPLIYLLIGNSFLCWKEPLQHTHCITEAPVRQE